MTRKFLASTLFSLALAATAYAALPRASGGTLRLVSPEPVSLMRSMGRQPFEASVHAAVYDTLYRLGDDRELEPLLADGLPETRGDIARIRLREGILRHDQRPLTARDVIASLDRTARGEDGWLLEGFARRSGRLDASVVDERTFELRLASRELDVARVLAAAPLAIAVNVRGRWVGTGPFEANLDGGMIRLRAFAKTVRGAPYLDAIDVEPPLARDEELRAFELARIDVSWHGESLYGAPASRPTAVSQDTGHPVVLLRNATRDAFRDEGRWRELHESLDRERLARVGLRPSRSLALAEETGRTGSKLPSLDGVTIRLPVEEGDGFHERLAETLAALLEERGAKVRVERLPYDRLETRLAEGSWDLRIVPILAPLPYLGARLGRALASSGQTTLARALATSPDLFRDELDRSAIARFDGAVLGWRRRSLTHRSDLSGVRFDALHRLDLAELHFSRRPDGPVP